MALEKELETYAQELPSLAASSEGKFVLIREHQVAGVFDTYADAVQQGYEKFGLKGFLVKQIQLMEKGALFHAEYCAMPHLNLTMTSDGPQIQLWVAVSEPRRKALLAANQPVPPPCVLRALIDTGAICTALDMNAIQRLQIPVMGQTSLHTPSTGSAPHLCNQYDVALAILDSRARPMYSSSVVAVIESDLTGQGIEALVGRDVLAEGLLLYNGGAGVFTLSF